MYRESRRRLHFTTFNLFENLFQNNRFEICVNQRENKRAEKSYQPLTLFFLICNLRHLYLTFRILFQGTTGLTFHQLHLVVVCLSSKMGKNKAKYHGGGKMKKELAKNVFVLSSNCLLLRHLCLVFSSTTLIKG